MEIFLTSSPFQGHEDPEVSHTESRGRAISEANALAARLHTAAADCRHALFISSDPANAPFSDGFGRDVRNALSLSGVTFDIYTVLDNRNRDRVAELIDQSDFYILAGGHTPTQGRFFQEIGLREHLHRQMHKILPATGAGSMNCVENILPPTGADFMNCAKKVLLAISAGSMNCAEIVYAQPEEEGESLDTAYQRFYPGLGLTKHQIIPHYQRIKDRILDGQRLFEDITAPDSMGRSFDLFPDGTYLWIHDGKEEICGEYYTMADGVIHHAVGGLAFL